MHIIVDALLVQGEFSGVQHAILHQLRALLALESRHRFTILALPDVPIEECLGATARPYTVLRVPVKSGQRIKRIFWEQFRLHKLLCDEDAEVLYSPGYLTSLRWNGPSVVFVHDTIALSHPQLCTLGNAINFQVLLPPSAWKATRVAVPSMASALDVVRYCHVPPEKVRVVPLGVDMPPPQGEAEIAAGRDRIGVQEPFLLAVSTIEPKKNFGNLIKWFDIWKATGIPHHLVIIGRWGWGVGEVQRALARSRFRNAIHLPGYIPQEGLPPIMAAADLLLVPSRYEGFGLPVLEAMAVGTPVVVSDRGALPETAGEAGRVIALDHGHWRTGIPILLHDAESLAAMRTAGPAWAAAWTWRRTAEHLLRLFEEVAHLDEPAAPEPPPLG